MMYERGYGVDWQDSHKYARAAASVVARAAAQAVVRAAARVVSRVGVLVAAGV